MNKLTSDDIARLRPVVKATWFAAASAIRWGMNGRIGGKDYHSDTQDCIDCAEEMTAITIDILTDDRIQQ